MSEQRLESLMDRIYTAYGRSSIAVQIADELREYIRHQQDQLKQLQAREARLVQALEGVLQWIDGWSPNFTYDPDWPMTREAINELLAAQEPGKGGGE